MIHLISSHNLNILSASLADKLMETAPDDPFISQKIIVPNLDTARWFKLFAAEQNGIAANLECMLPAEWLWNQIRKLYPELPKLLPSDLQPMKWKLFELLSDSDQRKKFERLNRYVANQPQERREQAVYQMAGQIASVFDEYLVYRPEMILRWQQGKSGEGDEKWQAELWRLLHNSWKNLGAEEKRKNRAELYDEVMMALSKKGIELEDSLYVLNPGLLSLPMVKMLKIIGQQSNLFLYQIKSCKLVRENKNELVQVFGRELERANDVILNLDPDEVVELFPRISRNRALQAIQSDIVNGNSINEISVNETGIAGVEIRSCHSRLREIEVLHQFLLERFEQDETLHPDDVLVATPDLDSYRPYIKAVFDHSDDNLPEIPYHAGYSNRYSEVGVERVVEKLLNLIDSRFEFSAVMDLFLMPPIYQAYGISESDVHKLKRWIEENHVIWGIDSDHRNQFDQPKEELQTWSSAIRRGWFGNLLGGEEGEVYNDLLLYQAIKTTNDQQIWASFSSYLHTLDEMQKGRKHKRSCTDWSDWLTEKMEYLFDENLLMSVKSQGLLGVIDQIREQPAVAECDEPVPYSIFKSELNSLLDRHKASGALFSRGVTFSSMVPVRSIPFKVIALIGLNENTFPRKQVAPDFDLMAQNPQPGERNRKNEDRNLFLESVMAAGDVHYCSYIGQSQVDNEVIPPSSIVSEWVDILSNSSGLDSENIIKKEALSGFSRSNFESKKNYSGIYFQTARILQDDADSISGLKLDHPIPLDETVEVIHVDDLIRFYSNPIQWFLQKRFEVSLREPDQDKDEFNLDNLEYHILFQRVFGWVLNGMSDQQIQKYLIESGNVPMGWAGEQEVRKLKKNVNIAISEMRNQHLNLQEFHPEIKLRVGEQEIEGSITSYSSNQFVDVNPSGLSGKTLIKSWVPHLCIQLSSEFNEKSSVLFCDLKTGEPKKQVFRSVENPELILRDLIDLYRQGLTEPQYFFPKTLFKYEDRVRDGKDDAFVKAASTFEGGWNRGEKEDRFIQTLIGAEVSFQNDFIKDRYRQVIGRMIDHMVEG
jgi:exodeoxyribonuclease V gamma subunit